jgi:hypothetical protein
MLRQSRSSTSVLMYAFILIGLIASGCDDQVVAPRERQIFVEVDPDLGVGLNPRPNQPETISRILVVAGESEKTVPIGGEVELGVLLFDTQGQPVVGERLEFQILDETLDGASLTSEQTSSDQSGYGRLNFFAGQQIREYEVEVRHREALPVRFQIQTLDLPSGSLNVQFDYQGPVPLDQLEVYLMQDPSYCDRVFYMNPPDDSFLSQNGLNTSDRFSIPVLPAGESYSVWVRARTRDQGVLAGGGCTNDIRIIEDETRSVTVSILLLPVDPAGRYEVVNHFNFTDAIPGQVGDVIDGLVRFFGDANNEREIGVLIFDVVENLAREAAGSIGGLVIDLIRRWVEDDLNELINRYIDEDGPEWIRDFFTIGTDLISVVSNLEVLSEMSISKARSDGTFDGAQNWLGLTFYWRVGCDENPDPECGRYPFTMDEIVDGLEGVNLVFGQFDGRMHSYNQGTINLHTMELQYGRLVLFILNHLLLPRIADGATSITDALLNLGNCSGFADRLTGGRSYLRIGGINIVRRSSIEGWCTNALSFTGSAATLILERLNLDTRMDLQGDLVFVQNDDDLVVDLIEEGSWWGALRTADEAAPPFTGDFNGVRKEMMPGSLIEDDMESEE